MPFDERTFLIVWLVAVLVTWPVWFWVVVRSRRGRGEPLWPRRPAGAVFFEGRASGRAEGWLGGASGALLVAVTDEELWTAPAFPFGLFIPYGMFGLDHRIAKGTVRRAEAFRDWRGRRVELEWTRPRDGRTIRLDLKVKQPEALVAALRGVGGAPPGSGASRRPLRGAAAPRP